MYIQFNNQYRSSVLYNSIYATKKKMYLIKIKQSLDKIDK